MHTILVVEDNFDLRSLYVRAIGSRGYNVLAAANGLEALDVLKVANPPPKLVILDLMMPVMDGWDFLRERDKNEEMRKVPVVICSAARDRLPPNVRFLQKPIDLDVLIAIVEEHCK